jgi:hypothetical protein
MMRKRFFRTILMIAGVLTVLVILLSQSFYFPAEKDVALAKASQKTEQAPGVTIIHAPADVVPSPPVQLDEISPTSLKTPSPEAKDAKPFFPVARIVTSYFNILFRAIISPNAP